MGHILLSKYLYNMYIAYNNCNGHIIAHWYNVLHLMTFKFVFHTMFNWPTHYTFFSQSTLGSICYKLIFDQQRSSPRSISLSLSLMRVHLETLALSIKSALCKTINKNVNRKHLHKNGIEYTTSLNNTITITCNTHALSHLNITTMYSQHRIFSCIIYMCVRV